MQAVLAHAQRLIRAGLSPADLGIITPYNAQASHAAGWGKKAVKENSPGLVAMVTIDDKAMCVPHIYHLSACMP